MTTIDHGHNHDHDLEAARRARQHTYDELVRLQAELDRAREEHRVFVTGPAWANSTRSQRRPPHPLAERKRLLAQAAQEARDARDALLTDPFTLLALSPQQREQATGLSRQQRRNIEGAAGVPPTHRGYTEGDNRLDARKLRPDPTPATPTPEETSHP